MPEEHPLSNLCDAKMSDLLHTLLGAEGVTPEDGLSLDPRAKCVYTETRTQRILRENEKSRAGCVPSSDSV